MYKFFSQQLLGKVRFQEQNRMLVQGGWYLQVVYSNVLKDFSRSLPLGLIRESQISLK